jgi:hypothetical protein
VKKGIILLGILLTFQGLSFSQGKRGNYNYLDYQSKPYYFGITLGINNSDYRIKKSNRFVEEDTFRTISGTRGPGFNLGIISNLRIGEYFDLRLLPTLSFAERNIDYKTRNFFETRKVESVFVEVPVQIRYKSQPFKDTRLFLIGGVKYVFDVASDSRQKQAREQVKIATTDFALEFGAGAQFFFPYFIFSPELKWSEGLSNLLIYDRRLTNSTVIERITSRAFTLSLHFEG